MGPPTERTSPSPRRSNSTLGSIRLSTSLGTARAPNPLLLVRGPTSARRLAQGRLPHWPPVTCTPHAGALDAAPGTRLLREPPPPRHTFHPPPFTCRAASCGAPGAWVPPRALLPSRVRRETLWGHLHGGVACLCLRLPSRRRLAPHFLTGGLRIRPQAPTRAACAALPRPRPLDSARPVQPLPKVLLRAEFQGLFVSDCTCTGSPLLFARVDSQPAAAAKGCTVGTQLDWQGRGGRLGPSLFLFCEQDDCCHYRTNC